MKTLQNETGRSMVEMLGVLAIIGILSIGGIQGYTFAMNKYHSNEIVNELNLLNIQLAMFVNSVHNDEAVMSLGEPYDTNETTKTGGYAFSYGCGQDPDSMTPCDLDETGYFMTLSGVSEDVCKSASQMMANMMNLVEQRVNSDIDDEGVSCRDGDNRLTFLFDANEGQGFENGEGEDNADDGTNSDYSDEADSNEPPLNCIPDCRWTGWLDSGKPNSKPTGSDVEDLIGICENGWVADISCRAEMFPNTPIAELLQTVTCNTEVGLVCRNQDQKPARPNRPTPPACFNYEINVYCCYCK